MSTHEERVAFINAFCAQHPTRDRQTCIRIANQILRMGRQTWPADWQVTVLHNGEKVLVRVASGVHLTVPR